MPEFAIAALALFMLVFGILDFGRAIYTYHTLSNAARLGSRWAIVRGSASCNGPIDHCNAQSSDVQTYVRSQIVALVDTSQVVVTTTWPGNNSNCPTTGDTHAAGCPVNVAIQYPFNFAVPLIGAQLNLSSNSQMVISQ